MVRRTWVRVACLVLGLCSLGAGQEDRPDYYPLRKGNRWDYIRLESPRERVTRNVTRAEAVPGGVRVLLDSTRVLVASADQLLDEKAGIAILRYPLVAGAEWQAPSKNQATGQISRRTVRVLQVGTKCSAGIINSKNCVVTEEADRALGLKTRTTYAAGIGPVKFEEFRTGSPASVWMLAGYRLPK